MKIEYCTCDKKELRAKNSFCVQGSTYDFCENQFCVFHCSNCYYFEECCDKACKIEDEKGNMNKMELKEKVSKYFEYKDRSLDIKIKRANFQNEKCDCFGGSDSTGAGYRACIHNYLDTTESLYIKKYGLCRDCKRLMRYHRMIVRLGHLMSGLMNSIRAECKNG